MSNNYEFKSKIDDRLHVSESEVVALYPSYCAEWDGLQILKDALWELGLDTNQSFELQSATQHRNRMNQIVTCARWLGKERSDDEWLKSGFASKAAIDKSKNCRMLDELYRQRGLTEDVQSALEAKDFYRDKQDD